MHSVHAAAKIGLLQNDYLTVALLTVIAYDYVLTLPREIDYIWNRRWTAVSPLFLLIRYCGLCILLILTLMWSSFLPGPEKTYVCVNRESQIIDVIHNSCRILYLVSVWLFVIWIGAADLMMALRAWAMYNRSRLILGILLTFWVIEIIPSILACIMYPNRLSVSVIQASHLTFCGVTSASVTWTAISATFEILNGAVICSLVIFQFIKRALEMYRVTKKWHFNRYMSLFVGQSMLYFLSVILFNRTAILVASGKFQTEGWGAIVLLPIEYVPAFALTPRFIMSVRTFHPRDDDNQGPDTDAGFSLSEVHHHNSDHETDYEATIILDIRRQNTSNSEMTVRDVEIPLEERRRTTELASV